LRYRAIGHRVGLRTLLRLLSRLRLSWWRRVLRCHLLLLRLTLLLLWLLWLWLLLLWLLLLLRLRSVAVDLRHLALVLGLIISQL